MNRRTAVKQLTFLSVSSLVGSALPTFVSEKTTDGAATPKLCVVLHGTFAVHVRQSSPFINLVMPNVGPSHIYTAGQKYLGGAPKLIGTPLSAKATYFLDAAPAVPSTWPSLPDGNYVAMTSCKDAGITTIDPNGDTFCTIILPTPMAITPSFFQKRTDNKPWFNATPPNFKMPVDLPRTLILSYGAVSGVPTFSSVGDSQPIWTGTPNVKGNYTLHLRAEVAQCPPPYANHFGMLLKLAPPLDTELKLNVPDASNVMNDSPIPVPGELDPGEEQTLRSILLNLKTHSEWSEDLQKRFPKMNKSCPRSTEVVNCQSIILTRP